MRIRTDPISLMLWLLLAGDLFFIGLHLLHHIAPVRGLIPILWDNQFKISQDRGLGEAYQYAKTLWALLLILGCYNHRRETAALIWGLILGMILLDDIFQIHEVGGIYLAQTFHLAAKYGLQARDWGEIVWAFGWGLMVLLGILKTHLALSQNRRRYYVCLFKILILYGFCSVVMDMVHVLVASSRWLEQFSILLEDGGEMLAMSLMTGAVWRQFWADGHHVHPA